MNFLKNLFAPAPLFSLGAHKSPDDTRNIHIATVQAPDPNKPKQYKNDLTMFATLNQLAMGTCVAQALEVLRQLYWYKKTKQVVQFSARSLYIQAKKIDGIAGQGTYPSVAAKILTSIGIASNTMVPDDNTLPYEQYIAYPIDNVVLTNMKQYALGGYVFVPADFAAITDAIWQNGAVTGSLTVDTNWFVGIIARVFNIIGLHYTIWYGYDEQGIYARNSWGLGWIAKVMGALGFPAGDFYFKWADYNDHAYDILAFVDIPQPIIDNVKTLNYKFTIPMQYGQTSYDITQLQKRLVKDGYWTDSIQQPTGFYGKVTAASVLAYQIKNNVISSPSESNNGAYVGPKTIRSLNWQVGLSLVDAMIEQESGGNDYIIGDLAIPEDQGGHAYGCLQIRSGVMDAVNAKWGTTYKPKDCIGNRKLSIDVFNAYWELHPEMVTDKDKCFTWNGGPGWRSLYGKPNYAKYTKALDAYYASVSSMMA